MVCKVRNVLLWNLVDVLALVHSEIQLVLSDFLLPQIERGTTLSDVIDHDDSL